MWKLRFSKHLDRGILIHSIIIDRPSSSTNRRRDASNRSVFILFLMISKPSDDVRHICGANQDNFKVFADTPSYNSISFDSDRSVNFPTDGAVSGMSSSAICTTITGSTSMYTS